MGEIIYKMSKDLFDEMRYRKKWNPQTKRMEKTGKPLTKREICEIINEQWGLLGTVTELSIV